MTTSPLKLSLSLLTMAATCASTAHAEPTRTASDPRAAETLFYEARTLMKDGKYALACPKLEESLRLDYGIGTEFNLADCRERTGKLASAWSGFSSVATAAKAQNQGERERVARDRAKALEARLPKLVIDVQVPAPAGLEVKRDGVVVAATAWNSPVPVDPGIHRVTAAAAGTQPWEGAITTFEGKVTRIVVPRNLPSAAPVVAAVPAPTPQAPVENAPPAAVLTGFPEPVVENRGATQRAIGYVTASAGLVGLGVAAGFGMNSLQKRDRARSHCVNDLCDPDGVLLRDKAMQSGNAATIASVAGGAALLGGMILVLTAPSSTERKDTHAKSFHAIPRVAQNGGGISFEGVFQ